MDILANITRGGQLTLHALRMFSQVFNILLLCSAFVWAVVFGLRSYLSVTGTEMMGLFDYYKAQALVQLGIKKHSMVLVINGARYRVNPATAIQLPYLQNARKSTEHKLLVSFVFSYNVALGAFILMGTMFIVRGLKKSGEQFNRGAQLGEFSSVKRIIDKHNQKSGAAHTYTLAGMPYPHLSEAQHTLVIGTTGAGKTVLISDLIAQIRKNGDKVIIYDKKCDYIKWFYDKSRDFILNPFDTRSEKWNLVKEVENIAHIKSVAESFIPDRTSSYGEKIWDEAARLAFSGMLEKLICTGNELTNDMIVDLLLRQDVEEVAKLVRGTHAQGTIDPNSPKTAASVIFTLAAYLSSLRLTRGSKDESFSIKEWVRNDKKDSILFISSSENFGAELAPLQTAWFEIAITGVLSRKDANTKTWVILDELPTLQRIPSLSKALSVSRSYGGCFVLGTQNIAQMREIYGRNITESISSECNTRAMFKVNDPDTAMWISKNIGEAETTEYKEGVSYGAHTMRDGVNVHSQDRLKSLILPSEVQNLPKFTLLLKTAGFGTVKTSIPYIARQLTNEPFTYDNTVIEKMSKLYAAVPPLITANASKNSDEVSLLKSEAKSINIF